MHCPKCHSENTQTLEMVYKQGTHNTSGSVDLGGVAVASGGFGVGAATGSMSGTSQSKLAWEARPPEQMGYGFEMFLCFVAGFLVLLGMLFTGAWGFHVAGLAILAFALRMARGTHRYRKAFPETVIRWKSSWVCLRCGTRFRPQV